MLWQIAQYVPVATGKWDPVHPPQQSVHGSGNEWIPEGGDANATPSLGYPISGALFSESDFDELGNSLWETFYDYSKEEFRQYHRMSKRVRAIQQSTADPESTFATDSEYLAQDEEVEFWDPEHSSNEQEPH